MKLSRSRIVLLLLVVIAFSFTGCKKKRKIDVNSVTVGLEGSPSTLDPRLAADAYSTRVNSLIYNGLVRIDENGRVVPDLAEKWEIRGKSVIFRLRRGVKFHNGKELTSRDVAYTLRSVFGMPSPFQNSLEVIERIETPDPHTVVLKLKKYFAPLFTSLVLGIVPEGDDWKHFKPIGTGPYKVDNFVRGDRVELSASPFYGERLRIKRILFRVIPDGTTRVMELENGGVDLLLNSIPPDMLPELRKNPAIGLIIKRGVNVSYLGFNLRDRYLKDLRVRRAIAMSIDRDAIIKHLLDGLAEKANSIIAPSNWAYKEVTLPAYDPEKAARLLDQAGYRIGKSGYRFKLEYKTSTNRLRRRIAEAIADQLKRVGIDVEVRSYEFGTFFSDIRKGMFQLYSLTWVGITDPDILYYAFDSHSIPPNGANRNHYENREFDQLVEKARVTPDLEERKKLYARAQEILARDLPVLPLWYHYDVLAYRKGLKGIKILPGGEYVFLKDAYWEVPPGR